MKSIDKIVTTCYRRGITFSKNTSMELIGSRDKLEQLVAEGKIRVIRKSNAQNSRWSCNAGDVLFYSK